MAKFTFSVSTMYVGSGVEEEIEIEDEELEGLNEAERDDVIEGYYKEWLWERIYTAWEEI